MAADRTKPNGRVLGVDIIPAQPPKGVSTIQGNFLAPDVQRYILDFLRDPKRGRPRQEELPASKEDETTGFGTSGQPQRPKDLSSSNQDGSQDEVHQRNSGSKTVDVVLSDMSAPWYQTAGFWKRSLSEPYNRMMNTSGMNFRDHAGSMVCLSLLIRVVVLTIRYKLIYVVTARIFATLRYNSASKHLKSVGILSANSTREQKIKILKNSSTNCSTRFIG